ncbi:Dyp-type peroxidase [Corynebacterium flavescens]|uniref:Dyp-type peroxidase n=1 Tax=Corynebacterium flavescens TaxID=28028 RepID=UPI00289A24F4|nr:Dyp-type peroxidase [Corynebacterium flavescens]
MGNVGPSTAVQAVEAPLTRAACFLVVTIKPEGMDTVRDVLAGIDDLVKTVSFRDAHSTLSCTVGIGSDVWPELTLLPRPRELHPFKEVHGQTHTAISTPGDLLFHIRADRPDLCFEFERILLEAFAGSVETVDEVTGFRYFDARDLLGFVDGTANPVGPALPEAALVGEEDPRFAGGSYILIQKYLHPLDKWDALSTEEQEAIIGRRKADNVELADATEGQKSHKTLNTITENGQELEIVRDNMPFGTPGKGEFGTYFIGYSRRLWVIEKMLERMFIGDPPGLHDRILDFSVPTTGCTFFAPSAELLATLGEVDESLGIGNNQKGQ